MNRISFSHQYPKLHEQTAAVLLRVIVRDRNEFTDKFVQYDTVYTDDNGVLNNFPLPQNKYMVLVFIGNEFIPFTTVRRFTEEKYSYYRSQVGNVFNVHVKQS